MRLGVVQESHAREKRVAIAPTAVPKLVKLGFEVIVERGAGEAAGYADADYESAGAEVVDGEDAWGADLVAKARPPTLEEAGSLKDGSVLVSMIYPGLNDELVDALAEKGCTVVALDKVPRTTKAQSMDTLSSMANLRGYRAVLEAAAEYPSFFAPQVTAAGSLPPARVLIIGAGVAGLAAIAAARGLGAEVRAFDTRPETAEQVESLGGRFLMLDFDESGDGGGGYAKVMSKEFIDAEMALFREQAKEVNIIITTALIPGRKAPLLVPRDVVEALAPGSVIVDIAAERGGNCELTEPDVIVDHGGVKIVGHTDLVSRMASSASRLFGANIANLLEELGGSDFQIDHDNEIARGACIVDAGEKLPPPERKPAPAPKPKAEPVVRKAVEEKKPKAPPEPASPVNTIIGGVFVLALILVMGRFVPEDVVPAAFLQHLTVFVLGCFVGWQVVWNVSAALHTPLMSVTNAISGIIIVGGMVQVRSTELDLAGILGAVAILVAAVNISGGFLVTQRMLAMFRRGPG